MDIEQICELSKDKEYLFALRDFVSYDEVEGLVRALNTACVRGVIVSLSSDTDLQDMQREEAIDTVKTITSTFSDADLAAAGLQRLDLSALSIPALSPERLEALTAEFKKLWPTQTQKPLRILPGEIHQCGTGITSGFD